MTQELKACTAFTKDPSPVPSTCIRQLTIAYNSNSRASMFWLPQAHTHTHAHTHGGGRDRELERETETQRKLKISMVVNRSLTKRIKIKK